jgi:hypothetical protein
MFKQEKQKYQWRYQFVLLRMNKRAEVYRAYEHCTHEAEKNETAAPASECGEASTLALGQKRTLSKKKP